MLPVHCGNSGRWVMREGHNTHREGGAKSCNAILSHTGMNLGHAALPSNALKFRAYSEQLHQLTFLSGAAGIKKQYHDSHPSPISGAAAGRQLKMPAREPVGTPLGSWPAHACFPVALQEELSWSADQ